MKRWMKFGSGVCAFGTMLVLSCGFLAVNLSFQTSSSDPDSKIHISILDQKLTLYKRGKIFKTYAISSSKYGEGAQQGSGKTPLGKHRIDQKIGAHTPLGTIFKARRNTQKIAEIHTDPVDVEEDLVTTRILWLKGLEAGKNLGDGVDSFKRYIYIHGTNEEGLIGKKASHGCIRMKNSDVVELFDQVSEGDTIYIE